MDNIKISKVNITLKNGKKISLTIEETIELKQLLTKTFDKEYVPTLYPSYPTFPYEGYYIPGWTTQTIPSVWDGTTTTVWDGHTSSSGDCRITLSCS